MTAANDKTAITDGLGEFLRRERELRQISLDEVAERTKINRRYLEAIEDGEYEQLPGEAFVRGFIRSYAQTMGLDPDETLLVYSHARMRHEATPIQARPGATTSLRSHERSLLWLLLTGMAIIGAILVSVVGWIEGPNLFRWLSPSSSGTGEAPVASVPMVLTATADSDTWLRVIADEQTSQDVLLRAGQSMEWRGYESFVLSIGNARATHLMLNGRELAIPPLEQSILRAYTISREMLP